VERDRYDELLTRYLSWGQGHPDVLGLVAVGSTAATSRQPDRWSDHDVLVVARPGAAAALRADLSWVPDHDRHVLVQAETVHGFVLLDEDAHLVELAIFDPDELEGVALEDHRVLLDRGGVAALMAGLQHRTAQAAGQRSGDVQRQLALLTKQLVIGADRHARGEGLSAHDRVRGKAVAHLLRLVEACDPSFPGPTTCTVDPFRRVELRRPDLAAAVLDAVRLPLLEGALAVLELAAAESSSATGASGARLVQAVRRHLHVVVDAADAV